MTSKPKTNVDLFDNPTPRVPVAICLDNSGSMAGQPLNELHRGLAQLYAELYDNELTRFSAEVTLVTFGEQILQLADFGPVQRYSQFPMTARGLTPLGAAASYALQLLEHRKQSYRTAGLEYHQPWLILMSDGHPTDNIQPAAQEIQRLVRARRLTSLTVAIGDQASSSALAPLSPAQAPLRLHGLRFVEFFQWLSASIERVSASIPGDDVPLDFSDARSLTIL